jgi:beta-lactamase class A
VSWDDQLTITDEGKTVGSSAFDKMPASTRSRSDGRWKDDRQQ